MNWSAPLVLLVASASFAQDGGTKAPIQHPASMIVLKPAPASMPPGTEVVVLEGDPRVRGIFTMRLKVAKGFALPLHTHPEDERVTVLEGSVTVSLDGREQVFPAGSFYVTPGGVPHRVWSANGALLQMTGLGPWVVTRVEPAAVPDGGTTSLRP